MEEDNQMLKEIGSLTGFGRDPNSSIYMALRDQELNQLEIRSIPNSRGGEIASSQGKRSIKHEKLGKSMTRFYLLLKYYMIFLLTL